MIKKEKPLPVQANRQGAKIKADGLSIQNKPPVPSRQDESLPGNSAAVQRQRILIWLSRFTLTTLEARQHLDILHPAARVMELRRHGYDIETVWVEDLSPAGEYHRVAKYILKRG